MPSLARARSLYVALIGFLVLTALPSLSIAQQTSIKNTLGMNISTSNRQYRHDLKTSNLEKSFFGNSSSQSLIFTSGLTVYDRLFMNVLVGTAQMDNGVISIAGDPFNADGDLGPAWGFSNKIILLKNFFWVNWISESSYVNYTSDLKNGNIEVTQYQASGGITKPLGNFIFGTGIQFKKVKQEIAGVSELGQNVSVTSESRHNFTGYLNVSFQFSEQFDALLQANLGEYTSYQANLEYTFDFLSYFDSKTSGNQESLSSSSSYEMSWNEVYQKGIKNFKQGDYKKARELLQKSLDRYPGHIDTLIHLGLTELRLDSVDRSKAISRFEYILAIDPDNKRAQTILQNIKSN